MTEDVLSQGSDRPPRRLGPLGVGLAALALLGAGIFGATRHEGSSHVARASATPSPTFPEGWTEYPPVDEPTETPPPPPDPFSRVLTVTAPTEDERPVAVVTPEGLPMWVVRTNLGVQALEAVAGPREARRVLGWCASSKTFEDVQGRVRFTVEGDTTDPPGYMLVQHQTRQDPADAGRVQIGLGDSDSTYNSTEHAFVKTPRCRGPVQLPALPPEAASLTDASGAWALLSGRYRVSVATREFCHGTPPAGCTENGREQFGDTGVLQPDDLAESYTYEGRFLVRTDAATGGLAVVLVDARVTSTTGKGVRVVEGSLAAVTERGGVSYLRVADDKGSPHEYVARKDVHAFLADGVTGLGKPGTVDDLARQVGREGAFHAYFVLDARGRVLRVVEGYADDGPIIFDPAPPVP